jgi:exodeoxyribonuclease V beta subunit
MSDDILRLDGPLPRGLSVLEASAGTGKTYAITAWATRWLVEGPAEGEDEDARRPERLLVVTFTRAAAAELRGRLRGGLRSALRALDAALHAGDRAGDGAGDGAGLDPWLAALVDVSTDELARRRDRAAAALAGFDRATVATLHAFCRTSLSSLGLRGDLFGREPAVDLARVRTDVVRDLLLDRLADDPLRFDDPDDRSSGRPRTPSALEERLHEALKPVFSNAGARLAPDLPTTPPVAEDWADLVRDAADAVRERLELASELSFDDLVERMARTLRDPLLGPPAVSALRRRIRLALVDEMQDTDVVQWEVLRRVLLDDPDTLGPAADVVIVGDPKQSIYRFRGADVDAYLAASRTADHRRSLVTNHRSSPALLRALDRLLRGATFGDDDIAYVHVGAPEGAGPGLVDVGAPLELRWVPRHEDLLGKGATVAAGPTDTLILADLAMRVVDLLGRGRSAPDKDGASRALRPGDIAVLVRSHDDASAVLEALDDAGVPAVRPRAGSVLGSDAAGQWRTLLAALVAPEDRPRIRALQMTWFVTGAVERLGDREATDAKTDALQECCATWRESLGELGVLPFLAALRAEPDVAAALARSGERGLTDLEHVAELLHLELASRPAPAVVVLRTLERLMLDASESQDDTDDPSLRRISTDGQAVQIITSHASKGLEYPVVLLPFAMKAPNNKAPYTFRDTSLEEGERVVDVASWNTWTATDGSERESDNDPELRKAAAKAAAIGDGQRLLYVALTRAEDKLVVWWAPRSGADTSALAQLLFAPRESDGSLTPGGAAPALAKLTDGAVAHQLEALATELPGVVEVVALPEAVEITPFGGVEGVAPERGWTSDVGRAIVDATAKVWSYSTLKRFVAMGAAGRVSEAEVAEADEVGEPAHREDEVRDDEGRLVGAPASPLDAMERAGKGFGDLVHRVLERTDLGADDVPASIAHALVRESAGDPLAGHEEAQLVEGLALALTTPLGPSAHDTTLITLPADAVCKEPRFTLPLVDLRTSTSLARLGTRVADALAADDPYRPHLERLGFAWPAVRASGWLVGAIDVVVRLPDGRYSVIDYKTTVLRSPAPGDPEAKVADYGAARMRAAMGDGLLPLQGLLYLVALHRWLGLRMIGYDPAQHLGGSMFLFVRGMAGPRTRVADGTRDGVVRWDPGVAAILAADTILRDGAG